jgi:hypothetical protein
VIVGLDLEAATGSLTIVKEATPPAPWLDWTFDGDLGPFTLDNDSRDDTHPASQTFEVAADVYTIDETNKKGNWDLEIVCTSTTRASSYTTEGTEVTVDLAAGDDVTCTYYNLRRSQIRIMTYDDLDGDGSRDSDEPGFAGWQHFLYIADGEGGWEQIQPREVRTNDRGIANYTSLQPGVDHLVCAEQRAGLTLTEPANPVVQDGHDCQVVSDLVYGEVRRVSFGLYGPPELRLQLLNGRGNKFVAYGDYRQMVIESRPFVLEASPALLEFNSNVGDVYHFGGRQRLGVRSPDERGGNNFDTIRANEHMTIMLGADVSGRLARSVDLRIDARHGATVSVEFYAGDTQVGEQRIVASGGGRDTQTYNANAGGARFNRIVLGADAGRYGLKGFRDAVTFRFDS